jgi:hypothetical protein
MPAKVTSQLRPKTSFLSLPGELRNYIYKLAVYPNAEFIVGVFQTSQEDLFRSLLRPSLFRTSRQVRHETVTYFCANQAFQIFGFRSASEFIKAIGPSGRESVAYLSLVFTNLPQHPSAAATFIAFLKNATSLKYLRLVFDVGVEMVDYSQAQLDMLSALNDAVKQVEGLTFAWFLMRNDYKGWAAGMERRQFPLRVARFKEVVTAIFGEEDVGTCKEILFKKRLM